MTVKHLLKREALCLKQCAFNDNLYQHTRFRYIQFLQTRNTQFFAKDLNHYDHDLQKHGNLNSANVTGNLEAVPSLVAKVQTVQYLLDKLVSVLKTKTLSP